MVDGGIEEAMFALDNEGEDDRVTEKAVNEAAVALEETRLEAEEVRVRARARVRGLGLGLGLAVLEETRIHAEEV